MSKGIDCASPLTTAVLQKLVSDPDDYRFACRYLAPVGSWKRLTRSEAQRITDAGLYIVSVFERGASNVLGGAPQGAEDGDLALQFAQEVGQPEGTPIYFAADTDVNESHYDAIEAYLRAADGQIPGYECSLYGEADVCEEMIRRGVVKRVWQTRAWSKGKVVENYAIYQYDLGDNGLGRRLHGVIVDINESNGDAGGWQIGMAIKQNHQISKDDAREIRKILSKYWREMAGNQPVQDYTHHLVHQVYNAAGMDADKEE